MLLVFNAFVRFCVKFEARKRYGLRQWGTLIDIMMLNMLDCAQTVGRWHTTDSKIEFGEDKKEYAMRLHCCVCDWPVDWKTTSKDCSLFDKILSIVSNIFSIRFPHHLSRSHFASFCYWYCCFRFGKDAPQNVEKRWKTLTMNLSIDRLWWWCGFLSYSTGRPACCFSVTLHILSMCVFVWCEWAHYKFGIGQMNNTSCTYQMALGPNNSIRDFFAALLLLLYF